MEDFYGSKTIKIITLSIVVLLFVAIPFVQNLINKRLPENIRGAHAKLTKDVWVKTIILFAGSVTAGMLAFFNGGFDKAITQAFFGICFFSSLGSAWTIRKTIVLIEEAKELSLDGKRELRIKDVENVNKEKAIKATYISFFVGLLGFLYVELLFDTYSFSWVWFVALISTSFAIQSAIWSEMANFAISKYAADPEHGE